MSFRLLSFADTHYASCPGDPPPARRCTFGAELLRRAVTDAKRQGGFDAIALMGDIVNDGCSRAAPDDLAEVAAVLNEAAPGIPVLAVPGNHDVGVEHLFPSCGWITKPCALGGYRFYLFHDPYDEGDRCTRTASDRAAFAAFAMAGDSPLVALQHNPLMPRIDEAYPYNPVNREDILNDYAQHGVLLSLSGHYHAGSGLLRHAGVQYMTMPGMCEAPHVYRLVTLQGRDVSVSSHSLVLDGDPPLVDSHCHTEFAYCGCGISADGAIARARMFGLAGICLVEHAPQLYEEQDDFWCGRHVREPGSWQNNPAARMATFLDAMDEKKSGFVRIGLEVEIDARGDLVLLDEHRARVDLLVGALHFMEEDPRRMSHAEFDAEFLRVNERLLAHRVDILAHPNRSYGSLERDMPPAVRSELVALLAATGTAAEINFHVRPPDVQFLEMCVAAGVKLAVGSDAHVAEDMGDLHEHGALLRTLAQGRPLRELLQY